MRTQLRPVVAAFLALILTVPLSGCAALCPVGIGCDPSVDVQLGGASDMNGGNAATIVVYQLSSDSKFSQTPIQAFWRDDEAAFQDEVVGRKQEVLLYPDEQRALELDLQESTNFVGFAANLRNPTTDGWRKVYPTSEITGKTAIVRIGERDLTVRVE